MTQDALMLIRADSSEGMGTGHVMRTLGLAQSWQDQGGKAAYAAASCPAGVEERLLKENIELVRLSPPAGSVEDALATAEAAKDRGACWVVVDGYHFSGGYQKALKQAGRRLLAVDDFGHAEHYWADVILNQDLNAEEGLYRNREPYARLLLGPEFVCLRRELRRHTHGHPSAAASFPVQRGNCSSPWEAPTPATSPCKSCRPWRQVSPFAPRKMRLSRSERQLYANWRRSSSSVPATRIWLRWRPKSSAA